MPWHLTRLLLRAGVGPECHHLDAPQGGPLYDEGGPEAVDLGRLIRAAEAWAILMIGSAFALVSAVSELALAYEWGLTCGIASSISARVTIACAPARASAMTTLPSLSDQARWPPGARATGRPPR